MSDKAKETGRAGKMHQAVWQGAFPPGLWLHSVLLLALCSGITTAGARETTWSVGSNAGEPDAKPAAYLLYYLSSAPTRPSESRPRKGQLVHGLNSEIPQKTHLHNRYGSAWLPHGVMKRETNLPGITLHAKCIRGIQINSRNNFPKEFTSQNPLACNFHIS